MLTHWSQLVPDMSTDIRGHEATQPRTPGDVDDDNDDDDDADGGVLVCVHGQHTGSVGGPPAGGGPEQRADAAVWAPGQRTARAHGHHPVQLAAAGAPAQHAARHHGRRSPHPLAVRARAVSHWGTWLGDCVCVCVCVCWGGGGRGWGWGWRTQNSAQVGERTQNSEVYYTRIKILGSCHSECYKFPRCYFHSVSGCTPGGVHVPCIYTHAR